MLLRKMPYLPRRPINKIRREVDVFLLEGRKKSFNDENKYFFNNFKQIFSLAGQVTSILGR